MKHHQYYTQLVMSGSLLNDMEPQSHLFIQQLKELDDEGLFAVLGVKYIMGRAYRKVSPEECAGTQHHMTGNKKTKFKAVLE